MYRALVFGVALLMASSAFADEFSAVAYNPKTGMTGVSQHQPTQEFAQSVALASCGNQCQIATWGKNAFVAIAGGRLSSIKGLTWSFGWSVDADRNHASEVALRECRLRARDCEIKSVSGSP